jgi:hypothetical protein
MPILLVILGKDLGLAHGTFSGGARRAREALLHMLASFSFFCPFLSFSGVKMNMDGLRFEMR